MFKILKVNVFTGFILDYLLVKSLLSILAMARPIMAVKAVHRITVVNICRYFVFDTLKNVNGPNRHTNSPTYSLA